MGIKEKIIKFITSNSNEKEWRGVSIDNNGQLVYKYLKQANHKELFDNPTVDNIKKYANTVDKNGNLPIFHYLNQPIINTEIVKNLWLYMDDINVIVEDSDYNQSILSYMTRVLDRSNLQSPQDGKNIVEMLSAKAKPLSLSSKNIYTDIPLYSEDINYPSRSSNTRKSILKLCDKLVFEYCHQQTPAVRDILRGLSFMGYNSREVEYIKLLQPVDEPLFVDIATQCYRQSSGEALYRHHLRNSYINENKACQRLISTYENQDESYHSQKILELNSKINDNFDVMQWNDVCCKKCEKNSHELRTLLGDKLPDLNIVI